MSRSRFVLILLLLSSGQPAFCQLSGSVRSSTGQPIPFTNVVLVRNGDSTLVKATLTDEAGHYQVALADTGTYSLRLSSIGYQSWRSPAFTLTPSQPSRDFGEQVLREDTRLLGEVVIRAQKPLYQQTAEGTVVHVQGSILAKGSSVLQVLERSPGVVIDYRNNAISLNGKSGITVLLNGKLMRMSVEQIVAWLNGLSANDIDTIELLTTPGARYDAEGSAGVINIVLKRSVRPGINGSYSLTGGYGVGEKGAASVSVAHNRKTLSWYSSYTVSRDRSDSFLDGTSTQNIPLLGGPLSIVFENTAHPLQTNHNATLGLDVRLSAKTTIGGSLQYAQVATTTTGLNRRELTFRPDSGLLISSRLAGTNRWQNLLASTYLERQVGQRGKLTASLDYLRYTNAVASQAQNTLTTQGGGEVRTSSALFAPTQRGTAQTTIQVGVAKLDYTHPLSQKITLELGGKGVYTRDASRSALTSLVNGVWDSRAAMANAIGMQEHIRAAYASIQAQVGPRTSLTLGARYEYSRTHLVASATGATLVDRRLSQLFPNVLLSRKVGDNTEWQLAYTKRISRPSYTELASFVTYNDPVSVLSGNPFLRPTLTNTLKLGYSHRAYAISVILSRDDYPINRYQLTESPTNDFMYISPQNGQYQNNLTIQTSIPVKLADWWRMSYGLVGGWRHYREAFSQQLLEKSYVGYSLTFSQSVKLPKDIELELSGWYNGISYEGTIKTDGFGTLNLGLKKALKKDMGTFQLAMTDLLRTVQYRNHYGTLTREAFSNQSQATFHPESGRASMIKLTYFRSFGSTKSTAARTPAAGVADEQTRIRN